MGFNLRLLHEGKTIDRPEVFVSRVVLRILGCLNHAERDRMVIWHTCKRPLGRPWHRQKCNMKKNLKDTWEVSMDCIRLAEVAVLEKNCEHSN